jgi:lipopolysaccharide export system protein LptA
MTVYSLSGGAWIYHKKVKLSSNTLEIIGEEAYKGFLKGQTKVEDPENGIMLTAGKGIYDKAAETVVLEGRPTLYFTDKEKKVTKITSPYLKRYLSENKTVFEGGAIVENGEYTIYSDSAVFLEKDESLLMENYPFIFGKDTFLTGEKVTYSNSSKNTVLENDTILLKLGYENQRKKKTLKKESKEVAVNNDKSEESEINTDEKVKKISLFTGEKMIYQTGDDETRYVGMFGNAKMIRDDFEFTGSYIKAFGKEYRNILE